MFENKSFTLYDSRQVPRRKLMFSKNCCVCHSETTLGKWGGLVEVFSPLAIPASCTYMYPHTTDVAVNTARSLVERIITFKPQVKIPLHLQHLHFLLYLLDKLKLLAVFVAKSQRVREAFHVTC